MTDATTTPTDKAGAEFSQYRRSQIAELRPYVPGEPAELLYRVSISQADLDGGSPKDGDMIARNPANHDDQWLVAADYFAANFEPLYTHPQPSLSVGLDREAVALLLHSNFGRVTENWSSAPKEKWHRIADRILALAAPAEGWQGIETAPKDGTCFLIGYDDEIARKARLEPHQRVYEGRWDERQGTFSARNGFILHSDATHWMPLPAAPTGGRS